MAGTTIGEANRAAHAQATQGWSVFRSRLKTLNGKSAPYGGKWYAWINGKLVQTNPPSQVTGNGGPPPGGGGGGGGGGGAPPDPGKPFEGYIHQLGYETLNAADKAAVKFAVSKKYDMAQFDIYYRQHLTKRYVQSSTGRQELNRLREVAAVWNPSLANAHNTQLHGQLKDWMWKFTKSGQAPTSANMDAFVTKTAYYKKNYKAMGYEKALDEYRNPKAFRATTDLFKQMWRQTFNEEPPDAGVKTFFSHRVRAEDFKTNLEALSVGADPYQWANKGQGLAKDESHKLMYGEKEGEVYKQRLARAYNLRKSVFETQTAAFGQTSTDAQGNLTQTGAW